VFLNLLVLLMYLNRGFVAFGCERRVRRDRDPLLRV